MTWLIGEDEGPAAGLTVFGMLTALSALVLAIGIDTIQDDLDRTVELEDRYDIQIEHIGESGDDIRWTTRDDQECTGYWFGKSGDYYLAEQFTDCRDVEEDDD